MSNLQIYRRIEDVVTPDIAKDPLVEEVKKHLDKFQFEENMSREDFHHLISFNPVLNISQILEISSYMKTKNKSGGKIKYLSQLVQKSYDLGNNDFIINNNQENEFTGYLIGTPEKRLKIRLLSDTGTWLATGSENCDITAHESVQHTGFHIKNCYIDINQDLQKLELANCHNVVFKIGGQIKKVAKWADYDNIKLILNKREYKKQIQNFRLKNDPDITIEMIK